MTTGNLATKLVAAGATRFLSFLMDRGGYNAELTAHPQGAVTAIASLLGWILAIFGAAMLVVACFLNLDKDMAQIVKDRGLAE